MNMKTPVVLAVLVILVDHIQADSETLNCKSSGPTAAAKKVFNFFRSKDEVSKEAFDNTPQDKDQFMGKVEESLKGRSNDAIKEVQGNKEQPGTNPKGVYIKHEGKDADGNNFYHHYYEHYEEGPSLPVVQNENSFGLKASPATPPLLQGTGKNNDDDDDYKSDEDVMQTPSGNKPSQPSSPVKPNEVSSVPTPSPARPLVPGGNVNIDDDDDDYVEDDVVETPKENKPSSSSSSSPSSPSSPTSPSPSAQPSSSKPSKPTGNQNKPYPYPAAQFLAPTKPPRPSGTVTYTYSSHKTESGTPFAMSVLPPPSFFLPPPPPPPLPLLPPAHLPPFGVHSFPKFPKLNSPLASDPFLNFGQFPKPNRIPFPFKQPKSGVPLHCAFF